MSEKTMKKVSDLFGRGYAPSQIDRILGLEAGTTHDAMIEVWVADQDVVGETANPEMVLDLFMKGFSPSQIDKRLHLVVGTAHDTIVEVWAADSRRGSRRKTVMRALDLFGEKNCA